MLDARLTDKQALGANTSNWSSIDLPHTWMEHTLAAAGNDTVTASRLDVEVLTEGALDMGFAIVARGSA